VTQSSAGSLVLAIVYKVDVDIRGSSTGERKLFRPHSSNIFRPIFLKLKTKKQMRNVNPHRRFCKDRPNGWV